MELVYLDHIKALDFPTVVCLGFFDGVHIGHAQLVRRAKEIAGEKSLKVCVHTFDQMPSRVLQPELNIPELTPLEEKTALLGALGVDVVAVSAFENTMQMRAASFFKEILQEKLRARHIVAGFHHRFGYRGEADTQMLEALCEASGIGFSIIEPVTLPDGTLVSSTAIRAALREGDYALAERLLGRACTSDSIG